LPNSVIGIFNSMLPSYGLRVLLLLSPN